MRIACTLGLLACLVPMPAVAQDVATVRPGMSEAEVVAAWGEPLARRTKGSFTYLHFQTDVVILEGGQVVDAIARSKNHRYDGVSSSPTDRAPEFTPPRMP